VEKLYRKGINPTTSFLVGLPREEKKDLRANIELMFELKKIHPFMRGNIYFFLPLPKTKLLTIVEDLYSIRLFHDMKDYEDANFWVKNTEDPLGRKYRPWLSEDEFNFLVLYGYVFNDLFKTCNVRLNKETIKILTENSQIRDMFEGYESVNRPRQEYEPYVLDKILRGERVDLLTSLVGK